MATITIPDDVMAGLEAAAARTNDTPERLAAELLRARQHLISPGVNGANGPPPGVRPPDAETADLRARVQELERRLRETEAELRELRAVATVPAPFDLQLPGPGERVEVRDVGPPKLEFWFNEDQVAE